MYRMLRRRRALARLDRIDADIARELVHDGSLSERPLDARVLSVRRRDLRDARLEAVRRLEKAGGRDPWPTVLRPPTPLQREGFARRRAA